MEHQRTQIDLLTKYIVSKYVKINVVDNKAGVKIKTLTLMRKLTTWETKKVSGNITLDNRGIILEM